jgi:hypothetical protein
LFLPAEYTYNILAEAVEASAFGIALGMTIVIVLRQGAGK